MHLTETCGEEDTVNLIVQAEITPATEQDVEETMPLLGDLQARDLVPEVRLVDSGYISGDVLAEHAKLGIALVGPLKQEGGWQHQTGYGLAADRGSIGSSSRCAVPKGISRRTGALDDTTAARR